MIEAHVPLPVQIVIDDVGWRLGDDESMEGGPFRTGMNRQHGPEDYQAVVRLGRSLGMRPQAAMILGEWDPDRWVAQIPTASRWGEGWDNRPLIGPWAEACAQVIRDNPRWFEPTLHGICHEYWGDQGMSRAEWHDKANDRRRPAGEIRARLDLFFRLCEHYQLGRPRSFVPCAFAHHFAHRDNRFAQTLAAYGITSVSTPFHCMHRSEEPAHEWFGFDDGLITVERGIDRFNWLALGPDPVKPPAGPICGMHWPALLHMDPSRNPEPVDRWVAMLSRLGQRLDRTLSPDTDRFLVQLLHRAYTTVTLEGQSLRIDARPTFAAPWSHRPEAPLVVKIMAPRPIHLLGPSHETIQALDRNDQGISTFHLWLSPHQPTLTYRLASPPDQPAVLSA